MIGRSNDADAPRSKNLRRATRWPARRAFAVIVFDLICSHGHRFESWFASGGAFDRQQEARALECPLCGNQDVIKAPMAPRVGCGSAAVGNSGPPGEDRSPEALDSSTRSREVVPPPLQPRLVELMSKLRRHVEANCDYVGAAFAEEARRIHYGEVAHRDIYGEASTDEAASLRDEGIEVRSIPWLPRRND